MKNDILTREVLSPRIRPNIVAALALLTAVLASPTLLRRVDVSMPAEKPAIAKCAINETLVYDGSSWSCALTLTSGYYGYNDGSLSFRDLSINGSGTSGRTWTVVGNVGLIGP